MTDYRQMARGYREALLEDLPIDLWIKGGASLFDEMYAEIDKWCVANLGKMYHPSAHTSGVWMHGTVWRGSCQYRFATPDAMVAFCTVWGCLVGEYEP